MNESSASQVFPSVNDGNTKAAKRVKLLRRVFESVRVFKKKLSQRDDEKLIPVIIPPPRAIEVEYADSGDAESESDHEMSPRFPPRGLNERRLNLSSDLIIAGIENGVFKARLPLPGIKDEPLGLRVHHNKVTIASRSRGRPLARGHIELPLFVEPMTLIFEVDPDDEETLLIQGFMKGFMALPYYSRKLILAEQSPALKRRHSIICGSCPPSDPKNSNLLTLPRISHTRSNSK